MVFRCTQLQIQSFYFSEDSFVQLPASALRQKVVVGGGYPHSLSPPPSVSPSTLCFSLHPLFLPPPSVSPSTLSFSSTLCFSLHPLFLPP
ncbi:hypothetical protein FHG87_022581 [Trinorchestia longiramus]|nr:hypothetical protein FHG87_022581 [Trinorchestia longiramus]